MLKYDNPIIDEKSHFYLDKEQWEKLCKALDQFPRDILALRKLAAEKTVLEKIE